MNLFCFSKEHYPERNDSVLSRVVASVTHNNDAEYVIYSSDLINVKDIAAKFSIPTYSKWMHVSIIKIVLNLKILLGKYVTMISKM